MAGEGSQYPLVPIPSPFPNIDFPTPYWINQLKQILLILCAEPDLMFLELAVPAALKAWYSLETPSTKQAIEAIDGQSWVCSARTAIQGVEEASPLASNGGTKFVYGLLRGLDTFAYYQFATSIIGQGLVDWSTMFHKAIRDCKSSLSPYRGRLWVYGSPAPTEDFIIGGTFLNAYGDDVGAVLPVKKGQVYEFWHWGQLAGLFGSPCHFATRVIDRVSGQVVAENEANTFNDPHESSVIVLQSNEGRVPEDMFLEFQVKVMECADNRAVAAGGGCYARAYDYPK